MDLAKETSVDESGMEYENYSANRHQEREEEIRSQEDFYGQESAEGMWDGKVATLKEEMIVKRNFRTKIQETQLCVEESFAIRVVGAGVSSEVKIKAAIKLMLLEIKNHLHL